jgi:hypothetical protein
VVGSSRYREVSASRRREVLHLLHTWGWRYGVQAQIAAHLGVHRSTICLDL